MNPRRSMFGRRRPQTLTHQQADPREWLIVQYRHRSLAHVLKPVRLRHEVPAGMDPGHRLRQPYEDPEPSLQGGVDDAIAAGQGDVGLPPIPGASQFSVIADISPGFDVDHLIGSCGTEALRTTLAGHTAIRCPGTGTLTDTLTSAGQSYWVEFPPGHTMLAGGSVISEDAPDLAVVEAILSTFRFTPSP